MKKINWKQVGHWVWKRPGWACAPPGVPLRRDPKLFYVTQVVQLQAWCSSTRRCVSCRIWPAARKPPF